MGLLDVVCFERDGLLKISGFCASSQRMEISRPERLWSTALILFSLPPVALLRSQSFAASESKLPIEIVEGVQHEACARNSQSPEHDIS